MRQKSILESFQPLRRDRGCPTADKAANADLQSESREHANQLGASSLSRAPPDTHSSHPITPAMELKNFTDSTDWIDTSLPTLEPLDAALRCEVCKEFYNNPVITSCAHTFCSLCIRRCISVDGKCPACRNVCQADKLVMNISIREVVAKWADARKDVLELARKDKEIRSEGGKKRKIEDTDLEEEQKPAVRQTRARSTRSGRSGGSGKAYEAIVVPDSEEEDDDEYVPNGFARCPICKSSMKMELVYDHVAVCTGESIGRTTRSKNPNANAFPMSMRTLSKEAAPPATRLSGLNYAMLTETALKKKLKESGIPNTGSKPVLIRRHQEWLNIFNSNCDAAENARKPKRELLRELDAWERTQGGPASIKNSHIMQKDFDGAGHATTHKGQFDDLIAQARAKAKQRPKSETEPTQQKPSVGSPHDEDMDNQPARPNEEQPYKDNEAALSSIRRKVDEANAANGTGSALDQEVELPRELSVHDSQTPTPNGVEFATKASRQIPMFEVPAEPIVDVESSNTT